MKVEELLWRLVDKYAPAPPAYSMLVRPMWFDHAGDLIVVDGPITWATPWLTEGGFSHQLPAGTHPVYAGTCAFPPQDEDPEAFWHTVTMVVIPLTEPDRIERANWDVAGYHDVHLIEDFAVLWGEEAMRRSLPHVDDASSSVRDARDGILAKGPRHRKDNWTTVVVDRETGANALVFPVHDSEYVTGYEIVDDEGELLCLVLAACG
ncbi:hypothetical protein [Micromonospora ureilytica]|uniref:hypothetical protein n=1 Tax=Micromonospora ureilytica TaxID=709868 RepID=UPI00403A4955